MHDGCQCSGRTRITVRQRVCCQGAERLHTSATQATQPGCRAMGGERSKTKGRVGQHLRSRRDSLGLQPRQTRTSRRAQGCLLRSRWARQKVDGGAEAAAAMRRATEIWQTWSRRLARAGKRRTAGCFDAGEGAKTVNRVSR
jgi:hypothetical protein